VFDGGDIPPFGQELPERHAAIEQLHDIPPLHPPAHHGEHEYHEEGGGEQEVPKMPAGVHRDHHPKKEQKRQPGDGRCPLLKSG